MSRVSHGPSFCSSIHSANIYLFIVSSRERSTGQVGEVRWELCVGYKARGHGRVEARVNWWGEGHHELECRMGTEFVGLFLCVVLNGSLDICKRNIWSNTNWQAATQWWHSGSEAI